MMRYALLLFAFLVLAASCDDSDILNERYTEVSVQDLPSPALLYIQQHHPGATIRSVWRDDDGYEVYLSSGIELNFNLDGTFLYADYDDDHDHDDEYSPVALADLPAAILDYVADNYPGQSIVSAWMDDDGYEVFLNNGLELNFALNGAFLYADHDDDHDGDDEYSPVALADLPAAILDYVADNYPGQSIVSAWMDDDGYELFLSNGLELNFALNGAFLYADHDDADHDDDGDDDGDDDDDGGDDDEYVQIAVADLPQAILDYIAANYPGQNIASAWMDDDGYEVYLNNGLELNFALNGTFLGEG